VDNAVGAGLDYAGILCLTSDLKICLIFAFSFSSSVDQQNQEVFRHRERKIVKNGEIDENCPNHFKISISISLFGFFSFSKILFFLKVDFANVPFKPFANNLFFLFVFFFYDILFHFGLFYGLFFVCFKLSLAMINAHNVFFCFVH